MGLEKRESHEKQPVESGRVKTEREEEVPSKDSRFEW